MESGNADIQAHIPESIQKHIRHWSTVDRTSTWEKNIEGRLHAGSCIVDITTWTIGEDLYISFVVEDVISKLTNVLGWNAHIWIRKCRSSATPCVLEGEESCSGLLEDDEQLECVNGSFPLPYACPIKQRATLKETDQAGVAQCLLYTHVQVLDEAKKATKEYTLQDFKSLQESKDDLSQFVITQVQKCVLIDLDVIGVPEPPQMLQKNIFGHLGIGSFQRDCIEDPTWKVKLVKSTVEGSARQFLRFEPKGKEAETVVVDQTMEYGRRRPVYAKRGECPHLWDEQVYDPDNCTDETSEVRLLNYIEKWAHQHQRYIVLVDATCATIFPTIIGESEQVHIAWHMEKCSHWQWICNDIKSETLEWREAGRHNLRRNEEAYMFHRFPDMLLCSRDRNREEREFRDQLSKLDGRSLTLLLKQGPLGIITILLALPGLAIGGSFGDDFADALWNGMKDAITSMIDTMHDAAKEAIFSHAASSASEESLNDGGLWEWLWTSSSDLISDVSNTGEAIAIDGGAATLEFAVHHYDDWMANIANINANAWNYAAENIFHADFLKFVASKDPESAEVLMTIGEQFTDMVSNILNVLTWAHLIWKLRRMWSRIVTLLERNIFARRLQWEETHATRVVGMLESNQNLGNQSDEYFERFKTAYDELEPGTGVGIEACYDKNELCREHKKKACWWCERSIRLPLAHMYAIQCKERFDKTQETVNAGLSECDVLDKQYRQACPINRDPPLEAIDASELSKSRRLPSPKYIYQALVVSSYSTSSV